MADKNKRDTWGSWFEFLFSCVGMAVGLGNIWRFPYVCFKNGGGAFLIPYFIFLFVLGVPVMFTEMSMSQWCNLGPGRVWICCPLFRGIGFGMIVLTSIVSIYYTVILSWTLFYLVSSFYATVPWGSCANEYNTDHCVIRGQSGVLNNTFNVTTKIVYSNLSKTASEEFWEKKVLQITNGIEEPGQIRWQLAICLLVAWTACFVCLFKGIKTSGKVVYVAATLPYIFLLILLIRGLMFDGAVDGLVYYAKPRFEYLLMFSTWGDAAVQVFYSAGLGWGGVATLASYNNFHNNCKRDSVILLVVDGLTSWFAGCVIFVTLGYMAKQANLNIQDVVSEGPGIAFMVYPEALATLPFPQIWSVLFFLTLFTVGLDSQMVHVQTITGAFFDNFPRANRRKTLVTLSVCVVGFLLGLAFVSQGGIFVLQLVDWYVASVSIMFLVFLEITVLAWIYGIKQMSRDYEMMTGSPYSFPWIIVMRFITPICILFVWTFSLVKHSPVKYGDINYPIWSIGVGWIIALLSIFPVPIGMLYTLLNFDGNVIQRIKQSIKPLPSWVPAASNNLMNVDIHVEMEKLNAA